MLSTRQSSHFVPWLIQKYFIVGGRPGSLSPVTSAPIDHRNRHFVIGQVSPLCLRQILLVIWLFQWHSHSSAFCCHFCHKKILKEKYGAMAGSRPKSTVILVKFSLSLGIQAAAYCDSLIKALSRNLTLLYFTLLTAALPLPLPHIIHTPLIPTSSCDPHISVGVPDLERKDFRNKKSASHHKLLFDLMVKLIYKRSLSHVFGDILLYMSHTQIKNSHTGATWNTLRRSRPRKWIHDSKDWYFKRSEKRKIVWRWLVHGAKLVMTFVRVLWNISPQWPFRAVVYKTGAFANAARSLLMCSVYSRILLHMWLFLAVCCL